MSILTIGSVLSFSTLLVFSGSVPIELLCGVFADGRNLTWHRDKTDNHYICCVEIRCPKGTEPQTCSHGDKMSTQCIPCFDEFYQPTSYLSTDRSYCHQKTVCLYSERVVSDGSKVKDRECECDLSRGFYSNPVNPGFCLRKLCPTGQMLTYSGECVLCPKDDGRDVFTSNCREAITAPHSSNIMHFDDISAGSDMETTSFPLIGKKHFNTIFDDSLIQTVLVVLIVFLLVIFILFGVFYLKSKLRSASIAIRKAEGDKLMDEEQTSFSPPEYMPSSHLTSPSSTLSVSHSDTPEEMSNCMPSTYSSTGSSTPLVSSFDRNPAEMLSDMPDNPLSLRSTSDDDTNCNGGMDLLSGERLNIEMRQEVVKRSNLGSIINLESC